MKAPAIPINENQRLKALNNLDILDTKPEERFDRITRMAKNIFKSKSAMVSLVDDHRQWFKSKEGTEVTETSREISFCGHAINSSDIFVVEDATKDERFFDNPLVTGEPHVRFYAGYPLEIAEGIKVGSFCINDDKPRTFSEEDRQILTDFGKMIEGELLEQLRSTTDQLTGISNRFGFNKIANYLFNYAQRDKVALSLLFIDVDDFKSINDNYGHHEGDEALKNISNLLLSSIRGMDVVARLGGDEFVVLYLNTKNESTEVLVNRVYDNLALMNKNLNKPYNLSISIGYETSVPTVHCTLDDYIKKADQAMYQIKNLSKGKSA